MCVRLKGACTALPVPVYGLIEEGCNALTKERDSQLKTNCVGTYQP
jgi:hypothetical protein